MPSAGSEQIGVHYAILDNGFWFRTYRCREPSGAAWDGLPELPAASQPDVPPRWSLCYCNEVGSMTEKEYSWRSIRWLNVTSWDTSLPA